MRACRDHPLPQLCSRQKRARCSKCPLHRPHRLIVSLRAAFAVTQETHLKLLSGNQAGPLSLLVGFKRKYGAKRNLVRAPTTSVRNASGDSFAPVMTDRYPGRHRDVSAARAKRLSTVKVRPNVLSDKTLGTRHVIISCAACSEPTRTTGIQRLPEGPCIVVLRW